MRRHDVAIFLEFSISDSLITCILQYYYAHAPKNFSTEGAQHFKEDGKIYGGPPVLIKTYSIEERPQSVVTAPVEYAKKISKFSWGDEETVVKVYIDTNQFPGTLTEDMVDVKFEEYLCDIKVTDQEGVVNRLELYK